MATLTQKRFESPDEIPEFTDGKGRIELVELNGHSARGQTQPQLYYHRTLVPPD